MQDGVQGEGVERREAGGQRSERHELKGGARARPGARHHAARAQIVPPGLAHADADKEEGWMGVAGRVDGVVANAALPSAPLAAVVNGRRIGRHVAAGGRPPSGRCATDAGVDRRAPTLRRPTPRRPQVDRRRAIAGEPRPPIAARMASPSSTAPAWAPTAAACLASAALGAAVVALHGRARRAAATARAGAPTASCVVTTADAPHAAAAGKAGGQSDPFDPSPRDR